MFLDPGFWKDSIRSLFLTVFFLWFLLCNYVKSFFFLQVLIATFFLLKRSHLCSNVKIVSENVIRLSKFLAGHFSFCVTCCKYGHTAMFMWDLGGFSRSWVMPIKNLHTWKHPMEDAVWLCSPFFSLFFISVNDFRERNGKEKYRGNYTTFLSFGWKRKEGKRWLSFLTHKSFPPYMGGNEKIDWILLIVSLKQNFPFLFYQYTKKTS